ncbi:E3 ubiquitin-protein ligase RNF10 [Maniola hyperantus]|uniref:E3 ubiquitin-protein ligase RNF10 n=1 Tax=Aphantopus hyperantus TaxID=2795564 RepID=UPI001569CE9A|nr:RING finger protein 10 [Maniola hyperantus]
MLEESRMDKKSLHRSLQQSRPSAVDSKKGTESTYKPWPRNNKKREGSGNVPKNDPIRKNAPSQRGRGQMDKRPRTRGTTNFAVGGAQNTGIEEDEEPEIGSVFTPGSKKQNLNHLLNFMYPSRGGMDRRGPVPRRQDQRVSYRHEHDLYLRAYCQFVVKEDGDYKVNLMDPDLPLKWEQIEEIVVRSTGKSECPICLGAPVAGRVGLCGHVYCWACILHYAAAHEKQPPPCPVCATSLNVADMKPTRMVQWESPPDEVTMRLVRRLRGSTIVEVAPPRGTLKDTEQDHILPLQDLQGAPFAKLFSATKQQVMDILERDRKQINTQILAEIDTTEIVYMEQALEMLKLKEIDINIQYEEPTNIQADIMDEAPTVFEKQEVTNSAKLDWFDVTDEGATCLEVVQDKMTALDLQSNLNPNAKEFTCDVNIDLNPSEEFPLIDCVPDDEEADEESVYVDIDKQNQAKYFYFYQAEDGQQVFLNSLNVRVLNASWGALASAPNTIRGRVLHRETFSLTEQTRKHMPFTAHLPLRCSFDIVELDLNPPFVTDAALGNFAAELERRARIRAKHDRDERRRERAYRRAMEGPPRPDFSNQLLFPPALHTYGSPPLTEESITSFESITPSTSSTSSLQQASPTASVTSPSGLSFAKMAGASGTWRVRKSAPPPPPPPPDEDEGSAPRAALLSDAIEAALLASSPTTAPHSGKKNKKSKQKVLFATGMHRAA